jgi:hypothetical protein
MTDLIINNSGLLTVCVTATAADVQRARELSLDWVRSLHVFSSDTIEDMLKTALSPTGMAPATDFLCCMTLTRLDCEHMQAHKARNNSPVVIAIVGPQEDTLEARLANRDRYLGSIGRKVVA